MVKDRIALLPVRPLATIVAALFEADGDPVRGERESTGSWVGRTRRQRIEIHPHRADAPRVEVGALADLQLWDVAEHLAAHAEVRARFAAWLDPDPMGSVPLAIRSVVLQFLESEITSDHFARMDGGRDDERRIPLARVFVDLPTTMGGFDRQDRILETLTNLADIPEGFNRISSRDRGAERPEGLVVVGGPGQGKTTCGQFFCQLLRSAWLEDHVAELSPLADSAVTSILRATANGGPRAPAARRFPIWVPLSRFAAALARGEATDLMDWVLRRMETSARAPSTPPVLAADSTVRFELEAFLSRWPVALIVDGLDEVPGSANRDDTVGAIRAFVAALRSAGNDVVLFATTRPQGYRGELSSRDYPERHLALLSPEQAATYAAALFRERHHHDLDRRSELELRFKAAAANQETVSLTRTPLQVTILATLLERSGRAPRGRWRLFREYFRVLWDRETERPTEHAETLQIHRTLVERLHAETGYLLQAAAEQGGETDTILDQPTFRGVIRRLVAEEGHRDEAAERLVRRLAEAALERLVFLVPAGEDGVAFELRSLQELFAAERLVNGTDEQVRLRLRQVARSAHWWGTLRFVVGKILADRRHLAAALVELCEELAVASDPEVVAALVGPRLALHLAEPHQDRPDLLQRLLSIAATLFDAPPFEAHDAMATELAALERDDLVERALDRSEPPPGVWRVAWRRASEGAPWARERFESFRDSDGRVSLLIERVQWISDWGSECQTQIAFTNSPLAWPIQRTVDALGVGCRVPWAFARFVPTREDPPSLSMKSHPDWLELWARLHAFAVEPSPASLLGCLVEPWPVAVLDAIAPWPIVAAARWLRAGGALNILREALVSGRLGGVETWEAAEDRWRGEITWEDIEAPPGHLPWREDLTVGPPPTPLLPDQGWVDASIDPESLVRISDLRWLEFTGRYLRNGAVLALDHPLVTQAPGIEVHGDALLNSARYANFSEPWLRVLDTYGQARRCSVTRVVAPDAATLCRRFPDHKGLVAFVAAAAVAGEHVSFEWVPILPFADPWLESCRLLLALATGLEVESGVLARHLVGLLPQIPTLGEDLARVVHGASSPKLLALRAIVDRESLLASAIQSTLAQRVDAAPTRLLDVPVARDLGLPTGSNPSSDGVLPERHEPVHLARLQIEAYRAVRSLDLEVPPESSTDSSVGQWLFLLGENGAGKTTLLRAVALALAPEGQASALLSRSAGPSLHLGVSEATVRLSLIEAGDFSFRLVPQGSGLVVRKESAVVPPFVVGFGSRRSGALGGTARAVEIEPDTSMDSLFDERVDLMNAETWLQQWKLRDSEERTGTFDEIRRVAADLLPGVDELEVTSDGVWVNGSIGRLPLSTLSDGYLGTLGWVLELIARWLDRERRAERSIPPDFPRQMTGLVLVDEIDLHLHPLWQLDLVRQLRSHFPRLSFVVTTHSPITVLDARAGELLIVRKGIEPVRVVAADLPPGADADRILMGPWFGLPSTLAPETVRLLEEHRTLLRTRPQDPRVGELEAEIRLRLVDFPGDSLEQMVRSVAAQIGSEESALDEADRAAARERLVAAVRRRRSSG